MDPERRQAGEMRRMDIADARDREQQERHDLYDDERGVGPRRFLDAEREKTADHEDGERRDDVDVRCAQVRPVDLTALERRRQREVEETQEFLEEARERG